MELARERELRSENRMLLDRLMAVVTPGALVVMAETRDNADKEALYDYEAKKEISEVYMGS